MLLLPNDSRLNQVRPASVTVSVHELPGAIMNQIIPLVSFRNRFLARARVTCPNNHVHPRW